MAKNKQNNCVFVGGVPNRLSSLLWTSYWRQKLYVTPASRRFSTKAQRERGGGSNNNSASVLVFQFILTPPPALSLVSRPSVDELLAAAV